MHQFNSRNDLALVLAILVLAPPIHAQDSWQWPDSTVNLQVLPSDWPGIRLRPVMTGFTSALGVACSHCHVGEENQPLTTYDFVSDDNPNKDRAREMLRMLKSVNKHLKNIEPSGDKRVNMWCHTCHRGRPRPMTLAEEMGETYRLSGRQAALAHYEFLRKNYHGKGAYKFTESALNGFGYEVLQNGDVPGAIIVFELNAKEYPKSANVWDSLAEGYLKSGHMAKAKKYYKKSLKLNPDNQNARKMLAEIKSGG